MCGKENGTKIISLKIMFRKDTLPINRHVTAIGQDDRCKTREKLAIMIKHIWSFSRFNKTCQTFHIISKYIKTYRYIFKNLSYAQNMSSHFNAFKNIFISHNINAYKLQKSHHKSRQISYQRQSRIVHVPHSQT